MSSEMQTKVQASPAQSFTPVQTGLLQRKSALCNTPGLVEDSGRDKEKQTLQRSSADQAGTTTVPSIVHEVLRSPGQPLDPETCAFMEPWFGHDFRRIRIHDAAPTTIQTKLTIGQPNDRYEQEADRVADEVMRMPEPSVQSQMEKEELIEINPISEQITPLIQRQVEEEEEPIQANETTSHTLDVSPNIEARINSIRGGGHPLPESTHAFFKPRFGYDFSWVRIHTGSQAMRVAKELSAEAFTFGRDIYFGPSRYSPNTSSGTRLLAHELAHVVQQQAHIQTIGEETRAGSWVAGHQGEANTNGDTLLQMYPGCNNPSTTGVPGTWTCDADCMINRANGTAIRRVADALLALSILQGGGSTDLDRQIQCVFASHFDTYTGYGTIASRFRAIQATLTVANYTCRPATDPNCSGTDHYGYAACPGGPVINVCPAFFAQEKRPFSHRVVYVIHEAAHVAGACDDVYYGNSGYPPSNGDNADSYACFVWDVAPILHGHPELTEGGCEGA